jgi:hypothetical protein
VPPDFRGEFLRLTVAGRAEMYPGYRTSASNAKGNPRQTEAPRGGRFPDVTLVTGPFRSCCPGRYVRVAPGGPAAPSGRDRDPTSLVGFAVASPSTEERMEHAEP